jgi:hypothetical protein
LKTFTFKVICVLCQVCVLICTLWKASWLFPSHQLSRLLGFPKKKKIVKTLLKVSSSALLDVLCSFLHSCLWKTSLITQFITYCFVESFQSVSLLFVHYSHSLIACITLVMDFVENLVDLQAWENNFLYILRST